MGFDYIQNERSLYCREHCMENFCTSLREYATNVINFEKKKILPLTKKRANFTSKYDSMLHLWKNIFKKSC